MIRINLLPVKRARKAEQLRQHLVVTAAALALTLLICAAVQWQLTRMVDEVTAEVTAKRAEIAALTRQIAEVNDYRKRHEELRAKLEILQKLESSRRGPVLVLDELYRSLPDKLWLESFKEGRGSSPSPALPPTRRPSACSCVISRSPHSLTRWPWAASSRSSRMVSDCTASI